MYTYQAIEIVVATFIVLSLIYAHVSARRFGKLYELQRIEDKTERAMIARRTDKAEEQAREILFITKTVHTLVNSNLTRVTERLLAALVAQRLLLENAAFKDLPNVANAIVLLDDEILALRIELGERIDASKRVEEQQRVERDGV